MDKLEKRAKKLYGRFQELSEEITGIEAEIALTTKDKTKKLSTDALKPDSTTQSKIEQLNEKLFKLGQRLEDKKQQRSIVKNGLEEIAGQMIQKALAELEKSKGEKKKEIDKITEEVLRLERKTNLLKHEISRTPSWSDGAPLPVSENNLVLALDDLNFQIEDMTRKTAGDVFAEMEFVFEPEKPAQPVELGFSYNCGECGLEKGFASELERDEYTHMCEKSEVVA